MGCSDLFEDIPILMPWSLPRWGTQAIKKSVTKHLRREFSHLPQDRALIEKAAVVWVEGLESSSFRFHRVTGRVRLTCC